VSSSGPRISVSFVLYYYEVVRCDCGVCLRLYCGSFSPKEGEMWVLCCVLFVFCSGLSVVLVGCF
jgi:hypothetical protein